tara:strand:+ start:25396 stop:26199 length:804 start_codon:yes stop_codon:yes gene_type:complete
MQNPKKCYENVWILSGTSDGPAIAQRFLALNYSVFISVVSYKASTVYNDHLKLHIITGRLSNTKEFKDFIKFHKIDHVVDATHPFAIKVSEYLYEACSQLSKTVFRFERYHYKDVNNAKITLVSDLKGINDFELKNKNILLAIGSRFLESTAQHYSDLGANVFTRIISTPESISKAFSSCIKNSNIAILNPTKDQDNILEMYLCIFWKIDYILCRDSGGYSQKVWEKVSLNNNIRLFLLKRPKNNLNTLVFSNYDLLVQKVINFKKK